MAAPRAALLALPAILLPAAQPDPAALLARVDRLRQPWPAFSADLALVEKGKETRWRLCVASDGDTRLDGLTPKEKGRAVLMKGERMWLLTPGSKRAIPVTAQQRLVGSAAGGDLARLKLAGDFEPAGLQEASLDGEPCWRIELTARRPSVPYRRAVLWIRKAGELPRAVDFYFASGKLAQTVRFDPPVTMAGRPFIAGLTLGDPKHPAQAQMRLSAIAVGEPDPARFEPPR
ncbi:MAG TPA: outer membrane lipoprotein-sorting protein [Holophagaceae bacterium]|nr:outer membrane lipoprotein-sorting protein [Holophagaceae bacterium]